MSNWLDFDGDEMRRDFNTRAFGFSHRLQNSPLFSLPRLAQLGNFLLEVGGKRDVYNAAAGKAFGDAFTVNGERDISPGEAITQAATSRSWMVLKRVEQDPEYRELVDACVADLAAVVPDFAPGLIKSAEGFIFVTSPGGITPYHMDPQWSFMAQIQGRKTYRIYDVRDQSVLTDEEIEGYYAGDAMAAKYDPSKDQKATVFKLLPGMSANQPLHAPHSAEVGDEVSIGMTVAIVSHRWSDRIRVHDVNRRLRRLGVTPAPVGSNHASDTVKSLIHRSAAVGARLGRSLTGKADSSSTN